MYYCRERWCWLFTSIVIFEEKVDCAENDAETFGGGVDISSKSLCLFVNAVIFTGNKVGYSGGSINANDGSNITFLSAAQIWKSIADWAGVVLLLGMPAG